MPMTTDRPTARRAREPGTPPRSVIALAWVALVTGTGVAIWLLPAKSDEHLTRPAPPAAATTPPSPATRPAADRPSGRITRPSGFVTFVNAARAPLPPLPRPARRGRVRWFTLGHLTAGPGGCTPGWAGPRRRGGVPAPTRLGRLRAAGGDAGLVFGGPVGRELAAACTDPGRLLNAYRQAVDAFGAGYIDFEIRGPADGEAVLRRASAIAALQREAAADGRPLTVSFTLPVTGAGLTRGDQEMLRTTREGGAEITTVNLLVPIQDGAAGRPRLRSVASAVRTAHPQIARSLGGSTSWRRVALTPVLTGPRDLNMADARRLAAFTSRNGLAWLSTRGATPTTGVTRLLADIAR